MARILVVDDDPILLALAETHLNSSGFEVLMATNGAAAMTRLEYERVDLITIDLEMPGMHGLDLLRRLRAEPRTARLPVVIITSHQDVSSIDEAYDAGASSFLVKPVNWALAERHLRFVLRASKAERTAQDLESQLKSVQCSGSAQGSIYVDQRAAVGAVVDDLLKELQPLIQHREIDVRFDNAVANVALSVDDRVFRTALHHYLLSAIKVTPRRGQVTIVVAEAAAGGVAISIRDQGPGMKAEVVSHVSSAEVQLGGDASRHQRCAADLVLARSLIEAIDGRIIFDVGATGGSLASLVFPETRVATLHGAGADDRDAA